MLDSRTTHTLFSWFLWPVQTGWAGCLGWRLGAAEDGHCSGPPQGEVRDLLCPFIPWGCDHGLPRIKSSLCLQPMCFFKGTQTFDGVAKCAVCTYGQGTISLLVLRTLNPRPASWDAEPRLRVPRPTAPPSPRPAASLGPAGIPERVLPWPSLPVLLPLTEPSSALHTWPRTPGSWRTLVQGTVTSGRSRVRGTVLLTWVLISSYQRPRPHGKVQPSCLELCGHQKHLASSSLLPPLVFRDCFTV